MTTNQLILEGIGYGLILTIMVGPIVIALTQTAMEKGLRAGIVVGSGVWVSDVLIVYGLYTVAARFGTIDLEGNFKFYLGLIGGLVLIVFGLGSYIRKIDFIEQTRSFSAKSLTGYFMKGFAVNTINPFTFIFWATLISGYVVINELSEDQVILFFGTIIGTITITDILKVTLAKRIRKYLTPDHLVKVSKIAGIALVVFGLILMIRVMI